MHSRGAATETWRRTTWPWHEKLVERGSATSAADVNPNDDARVRTGSCRKCPGPTWRTKRCRATSRSASCGGAAACSAPSPRARRKRIREPGDSSALVPGPGSRSSGCYQRFTQRRDHHPHRAFPAPPSAAALPVPATPPPCPSDLLLQRLPTLLHLAAAPFERIPARPVKAA